MKWHIPFAICIPNWEGQESGFKWLIGPVERIHALCEVLVDDVDALLKSVNAEEILSLLFVLLQLFGWSDAMWFMVVWVLFQGRYVTVGP